MQMMICFLAGLMLRVVLFLLLPYAAVHFASFDRALARAMAGMLTMFLLIRALHTHQHGEPAHREAAFRADLLGERCQGSLSILLPVDRQCTV